MRDAIKGLSVRSKPIPNPIRPPRRSTKRKRALPKLIASRIAQYCINLVDFSDPDATINPFFYDPNPFDGWWSYRDAEADWIHGDFFAGDETTPPRGNDNLFFVLHTPMTDANDPELDFYEALIPTRGEDGSYSRSFFSTPDATVTEHSRGYVNDSLPVSFIDATVSYSQALVWLNGQSLTHPGIGQDDFGFRIVWGMERPDLLHRNTELPRFGNRRHLGRSTEKRSTTEKTTISTGSSTARLHLP